VDEADLDKDPIRQFSTWLEEAAETGVRWPGAMTVATADTSGTPSARVVLLRGHDARGFTFFTSRDSRKGSELAGNPRAALVFYWEALDRQVRVEGRVEELSDDESRAYFRTRPRGSQVAAWASPQSTPVSGRQELEELFRRSESRFAGVTEIPLPPFWGGYRVAADSIEFWQSGQHRLHDRIRYERDGEGWLVRRLGP
jgi:pyridoxamine 5'-phosphate oxidase